jgi:hypothetical protein
MTNHVNDIGRMREDSSPTDYSGRNLRLEDDHKYPVRCQMDCEAHSMFLLETFEPQDVSAETALKGEEKTAANSLLSK